MNSQQGFSLLELLCALALSALILTWFTQLLSKAHALRDDIRAWSDCLETGRGISTFLRLQIQNAGNFSCSPAITISSALQEAVQGFSFLDAPTQLRRGLEPNSDLLRVVTCRDFEGRTLWLPTYYYVADSGRRVRNRVVYSFFSKVETGNRQEIFSDVDRMRIRYAISDGHQPLLLMHSKIDDWSRVVGVEIRLLVADTQHRLQKRWDVDVFLPFRWAHKKNGR